MNSKSYNFHFYLHHKLVLIITKSQLIIALFSRIYYLTHKIVSLSSAIFTANGQKPYEFHIFASTILHTFVHLYSIATSPQYLLW